MAGDAAVAHKALCSDGLNMSDDTIMSIVQIRGGHREYGTVKFR